MTTSTVQSIENEEKVVLQRREVEQSRDKICGICLEEVVKKSGDDKFGILSDCCHCFCWTCIITWRQIGGLNKSATQNCPECRVHSSIACPSTHWIETQAEKDKLIGNYREAHIGNCKLFKCLRWCQLEYKCPYYLFKRFLETYTPMLIYYITLVLITMFILILRRPL